MAPRVSATVMRVVSRAEHRRETLTRIGEAAITLFDDEGPSATIDRIALQAGVSRRTIFRWVESKEQLAFVHPMLWFDVFDNALAAMADDPTIPLEERFRTASGAIADYIDADPDPPRRAFMVAAAHPELLRGFNVVFQQWVDRVATEVLAASSPPTSDDHLRSRVLGAAVMGMVDAVTREWLLSPPEIKFADLYGKGFDLLSPLFADG